MTEEQGTQIIEMLQRILDEVRGLNEWKLREANEANKRHS